MDSARIGIFGEKVACVYLERKSYKILAKNYSKNWAQGPSKGEIDIVAKKDGMIIFIEVKTTASGSSEGFFPEDRINYKKIKQIEKMAQDWLCENDISLDSPWQIDGLSISLDLKLKKAKVKHFENI
jgi:putative endonuclease